MYWLIIFIKNREQRFGCSRCNHAQYLVCALAVNFPHPEKVYGCIDKVYRVSDIF